MQLRDVSTSPVAQGLVLEAVREVPEEELAAVEDTDRYVAVLSQSPYGTDRSRVGMYHRMHFFPWKWTPV